MVSALMPTPVITSAVSRAKTSELRRASKPITTLASGPAPLALRYAARPAAARSTTARFIRFGSGAERAPQPRRTELQRAVEPVGQIGRVAPGRDVVDDRQELGAGDVVGVLLGPGAGPVEECCGVGVGHERTVARQTGPVTPSLPPPGNPDAPVWELVLELASHVGERAVVDLCLDLLSGAAREDHLAELPYLTGHPWQPGDAVLDASSWKDCWVRTWGARGLLYVWDDSAAPAVVAGLDDGDWRPAEMCLKVSTKREVGGAGDGAARLSTHELPRVRAQAMRTLAVVGDTEHLDAVVARLDDGDEAVRRAALRAVDRLEIRLDVEVPR